MSSFEALQEEAKKSILGNTTGVSSLLGIKYPWGCTCEDVRSGNMTSEVTRKVKKYQYQLFAKTVYHYRTEKAKKPTEVVTSKEGTDVGLYSNIASTLAYKWFYKYYKKLYTDKYTFIKKARSHSLGTDGDFNSETKDLKPLSSAILQVEPPADDIEETEEDLRKDVLKLTDSLSHALVRLRNTMAEADKGTTMAENTPPDQIDAVIRSKLNCLSTRCEHINHLQPEKKKRALKHLCILCEILGNEKSTEGGNNKEWCVSLQETRAI